MIHEVKIKLDYPTANNIVDITNSIIVDTIRIQDRDDFSFDRGGFKFVSTDLDKNIPPYSICSIKRLSSDLGYKYYVISSIATYYISLGKWVHDCTLMSLESVLECVIVGAKSISFADSANDQIALDKILAYTNGKYKNAISITRESLNTTLEDYSNDYTFPTGTTLFDVCRTIASKNNLKFGVSFKNLGSFGALATTTLITDLYLYFTSINHSTYTLDSTKVSYVEYNQNTENYCRFLETEATDVIDRNTLTKFRYLTPRSTNAVLLNADEAKIILPVKVESIEKLELIPSSSVDDGIKFSIANANFTTIVNKGSLSGISHTTPSGWTDGYSGSAYNMIAANFVFRKTLGTPPQVTYDYDGTTNIFNAIWNYLENHYTLTRKNSGAAINKAGTTISVKVKDSNMSIEMTYGTETIVVDYSICDFTDKLMEESVWNSIDIKEQCKYAVYKSGGNEIYNLNSTYRKDFWGLITGASVGNFIESNRDITTISIFDSVSGYNNPIGADINVYRNLNSNPLLYSYNIDCYPFTNPMLIDTKSNPNSLTYIVNESLFKGFSRSYSMGDSNGFSVDFKLLTTDLDKQNDILGRIEAVVELNTTGVATSSLPEANDIVALNDSNFYISSLEHRYTTTKQITQINLSKEPFKVADAIGVGYQYNPTVMPLENIIERPIFYEITQNTALYNNLKNLATTDDDMLSSVFINFIFIDKNSNYHQVLARPTMQFTDDYCILYAEPNDNVVWGDSVGVSDSTTSAVNCPLVPIRYVDDNGAFATMGAYLEIASTKLTLTQSNLIPNSSALTGLTYTSTTLCTGVEVYKDPREKITFTFKINK